MTIGARADLNSLTFSDNVTVYGSTIAVTDFAEATTVLRLGANSQLTPPPAAVPRRRDRPRPTG